MVDTTRSFSARGRRRRSERVALFYVHKAQKNVQMLEHDVKEHSRTDKLAQIISELPLKEKTAISNMNEQDVEVLQRVFDLYVRRKMDSDSGDKEYARIMNEIWMKLRETHRLRIVK